MTSVKFNGKEIKVPESMGEFLTLTEDEKMDAIAYDNARREGYVKGESKDA